MNLSVENSTNFTTTTGEPFAIWMEISVSSQVMLAHGYLMIIAWMVTAPIGAFVARNYRKAFGQFKNGKTAWLKLHIAMQVLTVLATCASFVLIFVCVNGYSYFSVYPDCVHPVLGIIAVCLCVVNFLIGVTQVDQKVRQNAKCFRYIHFVLGNGAMAVSLSNIFVSLAMVSMEMPIWMIAFPIGFCVFHLGMNELMVRHESSQNTRCLSALAAMTDSSGKRVSDSDCQSSVTIPENIDGMQSSHFNLAGNTRTYANNMTHEQQIGGSVGSFHKLVFAVYVIFVVLFAVALMICLNFYC